MSAPPLALASWGGCPDPRLAPLLGRHSLRSGRHRKRKRILVEGGTLGLSDAFWLKVIASATLEDYSHSVNSEKPSQPTLGEIEISTTWNSSETPEKPNCQWDASIDSKATMT